MPTGTTRVRAKVASALPSRHVECDWAAPETVGGVGGGGGDDDETIVSVTSWEAWLPAPSVTMNVTGKEPASLGVPAITPLCVSIDSPGASPIADQFSGVVASAVPARHCKSHRLGPLEVTPR